MVKGIVCINIIKTKVLLGNSINSFIKMIEKEVNILLEEEILGIQFNKLKREKNAIVVCSNMAMLEFQLENIKRLNSNKISAYCFGLEINNIVASIAADILQKNEEIWNFVGTNQDEIISKFRMLIQLARYDMVLFLIYEVSKCNSEYELKMSKIIMKKRGGTDDDRKNSN